MRLPARLPHHCSGDTDTLGSVGRASASEEAGRRDRGGMKVGESASANGRGKGEGEGWKREKQREKHREKQREREGQGEGEGEREREMVPPDAERDDTGTDCCQIRCQQQRRSLRDQGDSGNKDRTTGHQENRTTRHRTQDTGHRTHCTQDRIIRIHCGKWSTWSAGGPSRCWVLVVEALVGACGRLVTGGLADWRTGSVAAWQVAMDDGSKCNPIPLTSIDRNLAVVPCLPCSNGLLGKHS